MLVSYHFNTWCDNPEDLDLNLHHYESLKSCNETCGSLLTIYEGHRLYQVLQDLLCA